LKIENLGLNSPAIKKEPVRIYIDGCFDLIHSGHYNAIRQAKALGDILVMGVNSDEEVMKNKGPTVLNCKERSDILRACKWIDEVKEGTEYTVSVETLDRYNC
jgi:ethanolamine-phosphate cytidylyltransferase